MFFNSYSWKWFGLWERNANTYMNLTLFGVILLQCTGRQGMSREQKWLHALLYPGYQILALLAKCLLFPGCLLSSAPPLPSPSLLSLEAFPLWICKTFYQHSYLKDRDNSSFISGLLVNRVWKIKTPLICVLQGVECPGHCLLFQLFLTLSLHHLSFSTC